MTALFAVPPPLFETLSDRLPWLEAVPTLAAAYLDRWQLTLDGRPLHGMASVVLPVVRRDGTPAMLKLQPFDEENADEALALRSWPRDAVVQVLEDDPSSATILLERLEPRSLSEVADDTEATRILAELLVRLNGVPAPAGVRRLSEVVAEMLDGAPALIPLLSDPAQQSLVRRYAAQAAELVQEPGDRLLHWDLHYGNVLAGRRAPWLVIDPKPLAGDPAFEVFQVLHNRWDDLVATGDLRGAIRRRFDLMVEVTGLERDRAVGWTMVRILQNVLWDLAGAQDDAIDPDHLEIARAIV
ncbi:aminoglycoside phosphotransferase family protein [Kribbella sp. CA-293567]|uniref:aminoglycoside phosphotransferase family protein n=1 Tax=Kribbella sp. CA-293567 TaxID=3002436 RepID=UPI0022DD31B0|nr:aminoglycoside phosphotransferase family protein [Kribbella sp. CA-293567]WBQ05394.1 hydroxyurea phosphotransferase [Kribbella sp. CA-293567]